MTETLPSSTRRGLSGTALKGIACVTMLIDHVGASCLENGFLSAPAAPAELAALDLVLRLIGRLAFPIFCFLLVEGFVHTHDVKNTSGGFCCSALSARCPLTWRFPHALCAGLPERVLDAGPGRTGHGGPRAL